MEYRFQIPTSVCFTINADNKAAAEEKAREFARFVVDGVKLELLDMEFNDADARLYTSEESDEVELVDFGDGV